MTCQAARLRHSGSYIVGVGVKQPVAVEEVLDVLSRRTNSPFYRVTYLSNYSPEVVPDATPLLLAARRDLALRVQAGEPRHRRRGARSRGWSTRSCSARATARTSSTPTSSSATTRIPRRRSSATARSQALHPWLESQRHLLARPVRGVALRGRQHGPLGGAGRGVGEPHCCRTIATNELTYLAKRGC